mmetsp:Transcript_831/g.1835  ORF Transcript_831/g.1835 Transcript_831/m.1835 type:complete len:97 (-) Transcript_831:1526-1816(-)
MGIPFAFIMEGHIPGGWNEQHSQEGKPAQKHLAPKEFESPNESPNNQSHETSEVSAPATTTKQTGTEKGKTTNSNYIIEQNIAIFLERIQSLEKHF